MTCPECGADTRVLETRLSAGGVRRRRACPAGHRSSTLEVVVDETVLGDHRLVPVTELRRLKTLLDRLAPDKRARGVQANLDGEKLEDLSVAQVRAKHDTP